MEYWVGVDGGASTVRLRVEDRFGRVVGAGQRGPGSLTVGAESAAQQIGLALDEALAGTGASIGDCRIACALAGHRNVREREKLQDLLADARALILVSDAYAALLGAHGGKIGAMVIVGTGSSALRLDRLWTVTQYGGWGPAGGDEGSGSWIGREAVRRSLRARDEDRGGALVESVLIALGETHEAILGWLGSADAAKFGTLAPIVIEHAERGDELAETLLCEAAAEIGRLVRLSSRDGEIQTALLGGLADTIAGRLDETVRAMLVPARADAIEGALMIARGAAGVPVYSR